MQEQSGWRDKSRRATFVIMALVGTWVSHTAQYAVGHGTAELGPVAGRVHLYMLPVGVILAGLAMAVAVRWSRMILALRRRLDDLRRVLTGKSTASDSLDPMAHCPSGRPNLVTIWVALSVTQIGLYLFQENAEAHAAGFRFPGLAVIGGTHWTAIPIHGLVALCLATAFTGFHRRVTALAETVGAHVKLWLSITRGRMASQPLPAGVATVTATPLERWGRQRWQRPPPIAAMLTSF